MPARNQTQPLKQKPAQKLAKQVALKGKKASPIALAAIAECLAMLPA